MKLADVRLVLQIHARYRQAGGEDRVVEAERQLLEEAGIGVEQIVFDNADLRESRGLVGDAGLAMSAIWSRGAYRRVARAIATHRPDVVHVHNTFAAASPSVFWPPRRARIPVVQTLHNYRQVCPKATLFRDGRTCMDCVGKPVPLPGVVHACVRHSHAQSAVAAATLATHRALGTYRQAVTTYVALTAYQRSLLASGGMDPGRIRVVPNFLEPDPGRGELTRSGVLFVGRLAVEKGVEPLLRSATIEPGIVSIGGDGPMAPTVERAHTSGAVAYLGRLAPEQVQLHLKRAAALVVPSIWFEGFPMVVLEAFASATPVLANNIGSLAEIVEDGVTGRLVDVNDASALAAAIRRFHDHPDEAQAMGARARQRFEERYRGTSHLAQLIDVYGEATQTLAADG